MSNNDMSETIHSIISVLELERFKFIQHIFYVGILTENLDFN